MDDSLKKDIRKAGRLIPLPLGIPLLFLPLKQIHGDQSSDSYWIIALALAGLIYILSCFFVLAAVSSQVIWQLPCRKFLRTLLFLVWLILYPALCIGWLELCLLLLSL